MIVAASSPKCPITNVSSVASPATSPEPDSSRPHDIKRKREQGEQGLHDDERPKRVAMHAIGLAARRGNGWCWPGLDREGRSRPRRPDSRVQGSDREQAVASPPARTRRRRRRAPGGSRRQRWSIVRPNRHAAPCAIQGRPAARELPRCMRARGRGGALSTRRSRRRGRARRPPRLPTGCVRGPPRHRAPPQDGADERHQHALRQQL